MNRRKLVREYFKYRRKIMTGYLLMAGVLIIVALLYQMEGAAERMLYAFLVYLFMLFLYGIYDFSRYAISCAKLEETLWAEGEREVRLPVAGDFREKLYQDLIKKEEEEKRELISGLDGRQKSMQDYYALWTHQIKTPIAALKLLLNQDSGQSESNRCYIMQEELFKIEQYVQMALQYSRINAESTDLTLNKYEIREIIRQAIRKYSLLFINKGLSVNLEDFECLAVTDKLWLSFVIEQLLSNACKYTLKGGVRIYERNEGVIVLEDSGIGIVPEDIHRIFEKGFTGYNGRMDKKSTGIGLYLCSKVMKLLGHGICVESKQGTGTKVILDFSRPSCL